MDTKIIQPQDIEVAVALIQAGELVAFPTETVYGLGADATNEAAVKKVYQAKGRPSDNPLIVHVAQLKTVFEYVDNFPENAQEIVRKFWPGPLTIILPVKKDRLSPFVTGGLSTAAFRMPNNEITLRFINKVGVPLVGPSANTSGRPSPTTAQHVFHDLKGKIAGIIDGGAAEVGIESTVLDFTEKTPIILRPGAITHAQIEAVIGKVQVDKHLVEASETPKAPGMKYKHYAPDVEVQMIDATKQNWQAAIEWAHGKKLAVGVLASKTIVTKYQSEVVAVYTLTEHNQIEEAMHTLFSGLRKLDEHQPALDILFVETFAEQGLAIAYMNRLKKAAGQKFFCAQ